MKAMKLLSFLDRDRESWGAVVENAVVDLGSTLPQYATLSDFLGSFLTSFAHCVYTLYDLAQ